MNKFKIINEPYYMGEACDCCEGYWYDLYFIEVDGERLKFPEEDWFYPEADRSFQTIQDAQAYILEHILKIDVEVVDEGYSEMDSYY